MLWKLKSWHTWGINVNLNSLNHCSKTKAPSNKGEPAEGTEGTEGTEGMEGDVAAVLGVQHCDKGSDVGMAWTS